MAQLFSPGMRVRLLHQAESGVVEALLPNGAIQVALEDGFSLELQPSELIADVDAPTQQEAKRSTATQKASPIAATPKATKAAPEPEPLPSVWEATQALAVAIGGTEAPGMWLVNGYLEAIALTIACPGKLLAPTVVPPGKLYALPTDWPSNTRWSISLLFGGREAPEPVRFQWRQPEALVYAAYRELPGEVALAHVLHWPDGASHTPSQAEVEPATLALPATRPLQEPSLIREPTVVDLHLEALTDDPDSLSATQAMLLQLKTFREHMLAARTRQWPELTVVHGKGTGRLKAAVQATIREYGEVSETIESLDGGSTRILFKVRV